MNCVVSAVERKSERIGTPPRGSTKKRRLRTNLCPCMCSNTARCGIVLRRHATNIAASGYRRSATVSRRIADRCSRNLRRQKPRDTSARWRERLNVSQKRLKSIAVVRPTYEYPYCWNDGYTATALDVEPGCVGLCPHDRRGRIYVSIRIITKCHTIALQWGVYLHLYDVSRCVCVLHPTTWRSTQSWP